LQGILRILKQEKRSEEGKERRGEERREVRDEKRREDESIRWYVQKRRMEIRLRDES
jgi:hypothetical protein